MLSFPADEPEYLGKKLSYWMKVIRDRDEEMISLAFDAIRSLGLSRPWTIVIALIAVALASILAVERMPVDIFPQVGDPAIYVAQPYGGMDPAQMEAFLTYYYEYHFLYITGIDHVESKSIQGAALMKLVFHQGTDMASAMGETIGYVNRARAFMQIDCGRLNPFHCGILRRRTWDSGKLFRCAARPSCISLQS